MTKKTKQEREEDRLILRLYNDRCTGMQIDVMRIPELFKMARTLLRQGTGVSVVADRIEDFVRKSV